MGSAPPMLTPCSQDEVSGRVWSRSPCSRPSISVDPPTARPTLLSVAEVPGEVSRQQVASFLPVAWYVSSLLLHIAGQVPRGHLEDSSWSSRRVHVRQHEQVLSMGDCFARSPKMCYPKRMKLAGGSGVVRPAPDSLSAWTHLERIQHSQYSGVARGSQPPEGSIFLPYCFTFLTALLQWFPGDQ